MAIKERGLQRVGQSQISFENKACIQAAERAFRLLGGQQRLRTKLQGEKNPKIVGKGNASTKKRVPELPGAAKHCS